MKKLNSLEIILLLIIAVLSLGIFVVGDTLAEQSSDTPESGEDSILKETYDNLKGLGYGSENGSYGGMWNRIISAANWVPEAGISEEDVKSGVEFYEGSRTLKTGSMKVIDWEKQSLLQSDYLEPVDYGETSSWIKTNTSPEVWYDEVTGLYWSPSQGSKTHVCVREMCSFFTTVPRGDYDGNNPNCGNAINTCATLSLDANGDGIADTNWYLPSQLELLQAYINGIYKKTSTSWVTTYRFWSSTEALGYNDAYWMVPLNNADMSFMAGGNLNPLRCVLRDL